MYQMVKSVLLYCVLSGATISCAQAGMEHDARIYVAGHRGLVGSALVRQLQREGYHNLLIRTSDELDLRCAQKVQQFFAKEKPDYVFLVAGKVGGIQANMDYPAEFLYDNLMISANVIHAAYLSGVKKLLFTGSSCIYPRLCPQPIKEEYLLRSELEKTNEFYSLAKIVGIKLCQSYNRQYGTNFIACMLTNLYGPYDHFDLHSSHVIPALIAKMYHAHMRGDQQVGVWGSGKPRREFLFVDDCADALVFLMNNYNDTEIINVGTGQDVTIYALAHMIKQAVGFEGEPVFDTNKPDGTPRKWLDVSRLHQLGWRATTPLQEGLRTTVDWYKNHCGNIVSETKQK